MGLKIIGALGTTEYDVVDIKYQNESIVVYKKGNEEVIGSPYSLITILHYLKKYRLDLVEEGVEFILLLTNESKEMHFNESNNARGKKGWVSDYLNLRAEIEYYQKNNVFNFPVNYQELLLKNNYDENDKWEFIRNLYEKIAKSNDEIVIDLSNGNRTIPTMIMLTTNLFESINSLDLVKGVYYINLFSKELVSLFDMYLISNWAKAINSLLNSGSYRNYRNLINNLSITYKKDEFIRESIIKISNRLEDVVDSLKLMKIGFYMKFNMPKRNKLKYQNFVTYKIHYLLKEIYEFRQKLSNAQVNDETFTILKTIDGIKEQFKWYSIEDKLNYDDEKLRDYLNENFYLHAYELLQYYKDHEMYQQAITLIKEVLFPVTKYVDDVIDITKNNNKGEIIVLYFKKLFSKINKYLENNKNNQDFNKFRKELISFHNMRNKINHAFQIFKKVKTSKKETKKETKIEFNYNNFDWIELKNKFIEFNNNKIESFIINNDHLIKEFSIEINSYHNEIIKELGL